MEIEAKIENSAAQMCEGCRWADQCADDARCEHYDPEDECEEWAMREREYSDDLRIREEEYDRDMVED